MTTLNPQNHINGQSVYPDSLYHNLHQLFLTEKLLNKSFDECRSTHGGLHTAIKFSSFKKQRLARKRFIRAHQEYINIQTAYFELSNLVLQQLEVNPDNASNVLPFKKSVFPVT